MISEYEYFGVTTPPYRPAEEDYDEMQELREWALTRAACRAVGLPEPTIDLQGPDDEEIDREG